MTRIKICGITNANDALAAADAGADFIGLVLSDSPRQADYTQIESISDAVAGRAATVGVFATEADLKAYDRDDVSPLDYYQVYFDYHNIPVRPPNLGWIRAFRIDDAASLPPAGHVGLLLCDIKNDQSRILSHLCHACPELIQRRTFLAGNLTPDSVASVVKSSRPFGVDVARGVESSPGAIDVLKLKKFVQRVRNA